MLGPAPAPRNPGGRGPRGNRYGRTTGGDLNVTDTRLAPGDPAPDFTLPDADGEESGWRRCAASG